MKQIEQQNKRVSPSPQKGAITERGLFRLMLPSLLGILLCSTCLAGLTWACFSDSVTSSANTITAATFTVEVTITEITEAETGSEGSLTTTAGAGSTDPSTNGSLASGAGGQEEPPSAESVTAPNTAAKNAEESTLMANVLSMETTAPSTDPPTNEEGDTDTGTGTQQGSTPVVSQGDEGSSSDTGSENGTGSETGAGSETGTGEGSTPAEGPPEVDSDPENEASGEGTPQVADTLSGQGIENAATDNPITLYLDGSTTVECNNGIYTLMSGKVYTVKTLTPGRTYTVTLKASNTATGYCNISFGGKEYHTVALAPNETISFTVCASEAYTSLTIAPQWGTYYAPYYAPVGGTDTAQIDNKGSNGTPTTDDNTPKQADSSAVEEPSADTDETLSGETGQSNGQTNNGETAGGTTENTTADTNDETTSGSTGETAETPPGESDETTGMSTDGDEEPANEGTDTEKANSEPSADEPTDTPSEGQSEE